MRRRITFSRNLTLSLSRTCRCHCKYCAFATHKPHLQEPAEVERLIDRAARRGIKELLVLTGEAPDRHAGVRERLQALGHEDFTAYVVGPASGCSSAACCRTRTSASSAAPTSPGCARSPPRKA